VVGLGEETIRKVLKDLKLTEKEADVYILLGKHGALKGGEIAKRIQRHKAQVYLILKSLQTKGLLEQTLEFPTRFTAVPFDKILDLNIKTKREEAAQMESARKDLLNYWKSISQTEPELPLEKFVVIKGSRKINAKIFQIINETKNQLSTIATVPSLVRADQSGLLDAAFNHPLRSKIQFRFLTELSNQNLAAMKTLLKRKPKASFNFKGKNPDLGLRVPPRMVIRDEDEVVFFIKHESNKSRVEQDDMCLWTNCKSLVQAFMGVFEDLWRNSTDIQKKIEQIETGKPAPTTCVISDVQVARKKYDAVVHSAEQEIIVMTSSEGLIESWKNIALLKVLAGRGVSIRIMAPVTSENFKAAQELSKYCVVRHVPLGYLETTIIDGKHLFQFEANSTNEEERERKLCFENVFYTTDLEYVKKSKNMLNALWKNTLPPSSITLQSTIGPNKDAIRSPPKIPWKKLIDATVIEEKQVTLTEKDVLNKIINAQKTPSKDPTKENIKAYGTMAMAMLHPPEVFNLPEMIIMAWHIDKQSSLGAEDMLNIYLLRETPTGTAYALAAMVGDNPKAVAFRKAAYARDPAGHSGQLVKKEELQVRVHGNTLFAGWTVPIPLFPQPYTLPPACILFEGYGELKTGTFEVKPQWSSRAQLYEFNGFEAFVTLFHPTSKYVGPGTDGLLCRDLVVTVV
jgi:sugar-specific transcriptional regulator TrmB